MPLIIPSNSITGGYEVDNSLRFDDGSTDYLSKTFGSAGNRKIYTISFWIKRSNISEENFLISSSTTIGSNNRDAIRFESGDSLRFFFNGASSGDLKTNALFRDVSAWYHILASVDTSQSIASNRVKLYINGVQETSFATETYPSQNYEGNVNNNDTHRIGMDTSNTNNGYNGYMAEVCLIDGQQLDPTSFGEFDSDSGIWKPKAVSGLTFGTNGFYLDFENSGSLGADVSGNGNNFTVNNLTSIDQTTDTPTNNYATLNSNVIIGNTSRTYSNGNLSFNAGSNNWTNTYSTLAVSQGKWYAEMEITTLQSTTGYGGVGILGTNHGNISGAFNTDANSAGLELDYRGGGNVNIMSGGSNQGDAGEDFEQGKIVGLAVDMDNKALYISENGTYLTVGGSVGDPTSGSSKTGAITIPSGIDFFAFAVGGYSTSFKGTWNFGSPPYTISSGNSDGNSIGNFEYPVPDGYFALCTSNLAEHG